MSTEGVQNERKHFEEWYDAHQMPLEANWFQVCPDGDYIQMLTQAAWEGWKARAAWNH